MIHEVFDASASPDLLNMRQWSYTVIHDDGSQDVLLSQPMTIPWTRSECNPVYE